MGEKKMKFRKKAMMTATVLMAAGMLAACGTKASQTSKKNLNLMLTGEVESLDNSNVATLPQWNVLEQTG